MALRRTLAHRLFSATQPRAAASAPGPCGVARRLPARPMYHSAVPPDRNGDNLIDRIRATVADRIRLDGILPPAPSETAAPELLGMTVEDVRKVIRATQLEAARARLRDAQKSCVAYGEFVQMCCDASSEEQGPGIARTLDEAGAVIVLGDHVLLRPDQVAKTVRNIIPLPTTISPQSDEHNNDELREMKEKKALIDKKANTLVRKELWGGLGLLALQTVGCMRLTFWEVSWDVMEPICFFLASTYFTAGYTFFMRTGKEPSFGGFFEVRFAAKQKLLMKEHNFDPLRFDELRRACPPNPSEEVSSPHCYCQCNL